jgi:predicted O-methyltransferase YrrM
MSSKKSIARHVLSSFLLSADDDPWKPTRALIELGLSAAAESLDIDLSELSGRLKSPPLFPNVWPGEHYKLLAAMVKLLQPQVVLEIGTATGLSALALQKFLPTAGRVTTFDLIPWYEYPEHVLLNSDFASGNLTQIVADLTLPQVADSYAPLLKAADLIFIDAAKDGRMEVNLLNQLYRIGLKNGTLLVFDDIRVVEMVAIWRSIPKPKLDLTSFGHWSGTGVIQWE